MRGVMLGEQWHTAFSQAVQERAASKTLKEAALKEHLGEWTTALTDVCVAACEQLGWQASAKGHELSLLPEARCEYLTLDVVAFAPAPNRWRFPVAVMELENSRKDDRIAYSLWKLLCTRAALRVVFCYRSVPGEAAHLVRFLQDEIIQAMDIPTRTRLNGETLVVVGGRSEASAFPYGFFKWWQLDKNTGAFQAV